MNAPLSAAPIANRHLDDKTPFAPADSRRTVIPTPRNSGLFPGWGVRV
jgi:hypothetical protein